MWTLLTRIVLAGNLALLFAQTASAQTPDTAARIVGLQGVAAQTSGNIRGGIAGNGQIIEALSNQQAQRKVQDDRVAADVDHQFSTLLGEAATGAAISIGQMLVAVKDAILRSKAGAIWASGLNSGNIPTSARAEAILNDRMPLYCQSNDPACQGKIGSRPNADRMAWAILSIRHFDTADDRTQATWVVNNLVGPLAPPPLTARQLTTAGGPEVAVKRGGWETAVNYARDAITDILIGRREPNAEPTYYNALATKAGVPTISGQVSAEDMDWMRYVGRLSPDYSTKLAQLSGDALKREIAILKAEKLQQDYRTQKLLEQRAAFRALLTAALNENKLSTSAGSLQ